MPRYAAYLRAINIPNRRATGQQLRDVCEAAGFSEAETFRNSGNLVFSASGRKQDAVTRQLEGGLEKALGFEVPVFLRSGAQVRAIAAQKPFPAGQLEASKGKLQVALLDRKPAAKAKKAILALASGDDRLAIDGRELYWLPKAGTQDSDLDMKTIDEMVGPSTMRTMGTIEAMAEKYFSD